MKQFDRKLLLSRKGIWQAVFMLMICMMISCWVNAQYTSTICSGTSPNFRSPASGSGETYTWTLLTVSGSISGASAQAVQQPSVNQVLVNTSAITANVSYSVTSSVPANNFSVTVSVDPTPTVSASLAITSICSGGTFSFSAASATPGTAIAWSRGTPSVSGIAPTTGSGATASIVEILTNNDPSARTVPYTINLSANGCNNTQTVSVIVHPLPTLSSTLTPADICGNTSFSYNPTSSLVPPGTFAWSRATIAGNPASSGTGNPNETLTNATTGNLTANYVYTLSATSSGCTNSQTVTVNVKPLPQLTTGSSFAKCSGEAFTYTPTSSLGSTTFNWNRATVPNINPGGSAATGSINEVLTNTSAAAATTTYVYSLSSGGCTVNNQNVTVTVNPLPVLSSTLTAGNVCSGNAFNYTPTSLQSPLTFAWSRATVGGITNIAATGTNSPGESLLNSTNATIPVQYQYTLTNTTTTCANSQVVTVNINPIPTISDDAVAICNHQGFTYLPPAAPIGTSYTWIAPVATPLLINSLSAQATAQPTISESIFDNGTASTVSVDYRVTPTLGACTGPDFHVVVTVGTGALATIDLASPLNAGVVCSNTSFAYTFNSNSPGPTYDWQRLAVAGISNPAASANTAIDITETLVNTTTLPVTTFYYVTVHSGVCTNTFTVNATVNPGTQLSSPLNPAAVCSNTTFNYTPTSATPSTSQYNWNRPVVAGISNAFGNNTLPSGVINETLINTTAAPVTVNYNFVLITSATPACTFSQTVSVVINPAPALTSVTTIPAVCSGSPVNYTAISNIGGTLFNWTRALATNINQSNSAGSNPINETLTNTSLTPATASYIIMMTAAGCTNQQTVTVTVNPIPAVTNQAAIICSGGIFTVTPSGGISGTQYSWPVPVVSVAISGALSGTLQNNISGTIGNNGLVSSTISYAVTPIANGCSGADFAVDVTVHPVPVIGNTTIAAVCSGTAFNYPPPSVPSGTLYTWSNPGLSSNLTGGSSQTAQSIISQTLNNTGILAGLASYTITPSYNSCPGNDFVLNVPVSPTPQVASLSATICSGNTFSAIPPSVPVGTSYTWGAPIVSVFGAVPAATAQGSLVSAIAQALINTTTSPVQSIYTVIPVSGSCTGAAFSVTVTINPSTQLSSSLTPPAICSNTPFNYSPTSNTPSTSIFNWTRDVVSGISNIVAAGSLDPNETLVNTTPNPIAVVYSYTLSTTGGCSRTQNVTVTVNPTPVFTSTLTPAAICSGTPFTYPFASATAGTTFNWSRAAVTSIINLAASNTDDPNEILNNSSINIIPVTYAYMLSANGCSNTQSVIVDVKPIPVVTNKTATICSNTSFVVNPSGVPTGTKYLWTTPTSNPLGFVTNGSNSPVTGQTDVSQLLRNNTTNTATATYTVIPTANNCAGTSFTVDVTVNPVPVVTDITIAAVCSGNPFTYPPPSVPSGTLYTWSNPVISPSSGLTGGTAQAAQTTISQTLSGSGIVSATAVYTITPSYNSCTGNSFDLTVPVNPTPQVGPLSATICSGNTFTVTPPSVPVGTSYTWAAPAITPSGSVSGATLQSSPAVSIAQLLTNTTTAAVQSVYSVIPLSGSCTGAAFPVTVAINPSTQLSSSLTPADVCSNNPFNYSPTSNTPSTISYNWTRAAVGGISNLASSGSGNPGETLINSSNAPVNVVYSYTLNTTGGCSRTESVTVVVNPTPILNTSLTAAVCSGTTFSYTPNSAIGGTTYAWSRAGYTFISNPAGTGSGDPNETLTNTSTNTIPVTYVYTLSANGCSNTQSLVVAVTPIPIVTNKTVTICSNTSFLINPTGVPVGTQYTWANPASNPLGVVTGGSAQMLQNTINQTLSNTTISPAVSSYTVTPEANGCTGTAFTVSVTVNPIPVASNYAHAAVCSGNTFTYTPASLPAGTTYSWGNPVLTPLQGLTGGSAQSVQAVISQTLISNNNVANTAVYSVIPSANGCSGSSFQVTVPVNPVPVVANTTASICSGNSFTVTPGSVPIGTTYTWTAPVHTPNGTVIGSSAQSTPQTSISQLLSNTTTVAVQSVYTVTPATGSCNGTPFTITVGVNPGTQLNLSVTPAAICSNSNFSYAAASNTPGTSFQWTRSILGGITNPASSGTGNPMEVLFNITTQPITVTYAYTLTTPAGCTNAETVSVRVNPTPSFTSLLNVPAICSGTTFNYNPVSTMTGTSFTWTRNTVAFISNNAASGPGNPAEILVNTSLNSVNTFYDYILTANGCSNNQTVTVPVSPTPTITNQTTATCNNIAFALLPTNVPANTRYTWTTPVINPLGSVSGATAETFAQTNISQLLVNQTLNAAITRYTVTPTAGSCVGATFSIDVTINPSATIANQTMAAVCSGSTFTYTPSNVPAGTVYTWSNPVLNPQNSLTGAGAEAVSKPSISQTLSSTNNLVNNAVYTVSPSTNGCSGASFILTVPVNPVPVINNMRDTICTGSSFSTTASPVPANTTYTWAAPVNFPFGSLVGSTAQVLQAPTISQTLINTTTNTAQALYTILPTANGCAGNTFTLSVVVGAVLPAIPNQTVTSCSGAPFNASPGGQRIGTTYTWGAPSVTPAGSITGYSAANTPQTTISQILDNLLTNTSTVVYTVTARNTGCISNSFTATVLVQPTPRTFVTGNPVICRYPYDTLSITFTGQAPWGFDYTDNNGISRSVTGIVTSPYRLAVPSTTAPSRTLAFLKASHNACINVKDTVYFSQIINPLPIGVIHSLHGTYICNNILDTMFITSPDSLSYQWTRNGVSLAGATNDSLATNIGGRYNAMLVNQYGCRDTVASQMALVYVPQPVLRLTYDTYCINTLMNFTNITDTNFTGPTQWLWSFDNGTTSRSFHSNTVFATGGDHHIQLKATQLYCPTYPTTLDTTVNINFPIPGVTMPSVSAYKGVYTPVSVRSLPGYRYQWTPPYGISKPDSANTFFNNANTQQYVVNLISPAGCVTKDSVLIRVFDDKLVDIFVPKSFTPNGDGVNDILYPYLTGIKQFQYFKVYNRYNQLMFETKNYDVGWNGSLNGTAQTMGIYIWVAVGVANDGSMVQKTGQVLLLR
jgi:gliding motility-associated-like protein